MKKTVILLAVLALAHSNYCKANSRPAALLVPTTYLQQDTLAVYTGKYESIQKRGTVYVDVSLVDGELIATASWDGSKFALKHLSGDNFLAFGYDWAVKFKRDKENHIIQMGVAGGTIFTKVKK